MCQWETTECHCCSCHNAHTLRPFRTGFVDNFCWLCAGSFIRRLRCCSAGRSARAHTATWDLLNKLNLELAEHTTFELIPGQWLWFQCLGVTRVWYSLLSLWSSRAVSIYFVCACWWCGRQKSILAWVTSCECTTLVHCAIGNHINKVNTDTFLALCSGTVQWVQDWLHSFPCAAAEWRHPVPGPMVRA